MAHPREGLERAALRYLLQRSGSTQQVRRFMERRLDRIARKEERVRDEEERALDEAAIVAVLSKLERLEYLDDARYAKGKMKSMRARGASSRKIRAKLQEKGIDSDVVDERLDEEADESELIAALRLAKRRRFGPYRTKEHSRELEQKELAAIGRAGFGYGVAKRVLEMERDAADALIRG